MEVPEAIQEEPLYSERVEKTGAALIHTDAKFYSFADFELAFEQFKMTYFHPFRVASSEQLREPDGSINHVFKYRYIVYHCTHYGQPRQKAPGARSGKVRATPSLACGCEAMLRLSFSFNEKVLKIAQIIDQHEGHDVSMDSYCGLQPKREKKKALPTAKEAPSPAMIPNLPPILSLHQRFFSHEEAKQAVKSVRPILQSYGRSFFSDEISPATKLLFKYRVESYGCKYGQSEFGFSCQANVRLEYVSEEKCLVITRLRLEHFHPAEPTPNLKRRRTEYKYEQRSEPATVPLAVRHGNTNGMQGGGQHDMSGWAQHQMNMNPQFAALMAHQQRMTAVLMAQKENMPSPQSHHSNQSPSINNALAPINNHSVTPPQLAGLPRPQPQLPAAHLPQGMLLNFLMHQQRLMSMANTPNHGLVAPVMHPVAEPTPAVTENSDGEVDVESFSVQSPDHFSNEVPLTPQRAAADEVEAAAPIAAATPQSAATSTYPAATATLTTLHPVTFTPMATVKQELQKLGFVPQHKLQKVAAMQQNVAAMQQNVAAMHQMPSTPGDVVRKLLDNLGTLIEADPVAREQRIAHIANVVRIWSS